MDLSWAAPGSDGGARVSGYDIYEATAPGGTANLAGTAPAQATGYTITELRPGTTYRFYVTALNSAGESQRSNEVWAKLQVAVPGPPISLRASAGADRVDLSWAAPGSDGGAQVSGYDIYEATAPGSAASLAGRTTGGATTYRVTGLRPGANYRFYVTALNSAGASHTLERTAGEARSSCARPPHGPYSQARCRPGQPVVGSP